LNEVFRFKKHTADFYSLPNHHRLNLTC